MFRLLFHRCAPSPLVLGCSRPLVGVDAESSEVVQETPHPLFLMAPHTRALSLRNLVSGYECGRVFPAGVGPGSPSRDAVNWLLSRFSLSVETRRRYGWLTMMVFPSARLFRAPIGALREGGGTREAGSTVAESLVVLYRVGTHQIRRRRRAAQSSTSQGRAEPLCARITGLNREVSEGKADDV